MTSEQESQPEPAQLPLASTAIKSAALAELDSVSAFVRDLTLENWTRASAAQGWSIGDVVAHLNLVLGVHGRLLDAVLAGAGAGRIWRTLSEAGKRVAPAAAPAWNAVNSAIPRLIDRTLSPEVIRGQFAASSRHYREKLTRIESVDFTRPVYYMGSPWPLSFLLAMVVNELAMHGWDMASPLDLNAHLSEAARSVLPWYYWSGTALMLRPPGGVSGTIQATLRDPSLELWWTINDQGTNQGMGQTGLPTATVAAETGTFVLVLGGRIPPAEAIRATSLTVGGDADLARTFLGSWKLI